ncbi:hypothetical protein ACUN24_20115 [Pedobacter sp. WC2501]|uniref:hypothetical protein n=1 Tax=Pedobacter sp. WC2501 TaxID=3461400 RepID=UPI00404564CB
MDKQTFLNEVLSGSYLPLSLKTQTDENSYQLYKINVLIENSPKYYLIDQARQSLFQLSLVGKPAPKFEFVDLAGHKYDNQNTREGNPCNENLVYQLCCLCTRNA